MLLLHQKAFGPVGTELGDGQQNSRSAARQQHGKGGGSANANANASLGISPPISWGAMERIYPRYPTIESIDLSDAERRMWMDLRPYVNTAPYVINGGLMFPLFLLVACCCRCRRCLLLLLSLLSMSSLLVVVVGCCCDCYCCCCRCLF